MVTRSLSHSAKLAPVLLLGAGTGEATCGILYLASYLRRNDIEAFVRLNDFDESKMEIKKTLNQLISHVKPRLIGISLKWFHHVHRALLMAQFIKEIDPKIHVVVGGNSATSWCQNLLAFDCIDSVILGDGEVPLLALARGELPHANVVTRNKVNLDDSNDKYIQGNKSDDVYYSHFKDIFLSQLDLSTYSGWVAPGKGCGENCLYCSGTRGMQKAVFGRAKPFLRSIESVQKDHLEIADCTWQMRYDFAGSTAAFLEKTWAPVDLSKHSATYFLWGVPPIELAAVLSKTFQRVYMVLDIGCFSELQRVETMKRGLLKPCPTDAQLMKVIEACEKHSNLQLEISGIAGLPFANHFTLKQEKQLVQQLLKNRNAIGYQRLEAQPGALVTEHPERFEMHAEAKTFDEFVDYFQHRPSADVSVPMIRYADNRMESAVQNNADAVDELVWKSVENKQLVNLKATTRLIDASVSKQQFTLQKWLGPQLTNLKIANEPVHVIRSVTGAGLTCAPTVNSKQMNNRLVQNGEEASDMLSVLSAFSKPLSVQSACTQLMSQMKMSPQTSHELIEQLVSAEFLKSAK